ncbi:IS110 family RNA-guided transposase [Methanogenium cariaci]|jgi:transposase
MSSQIHNSCGLDVHKQFIIATTLTDTDSLKKQKRFEWNENGLSEFKSWVLSEQCDVIACESTSDYWVPIYDSLNDHIPVIVGNARDIKAFTHKKTDNVDSEFIAKLALNGMIQPSRVFTQEVRGFRSLIRQRHIFVRKRSDIKNEAHSVLSNEEFHLDNVLSDIFGKGGRRILSGIISGTPVNEIIESLPKNLRKKRDQILEVLNAEISENTALRLKSCLTMIDAFDGEIGSLENEFFHYAYARYPREMKILTSVPGIGELGAATLLAEIGDFHDFPSGDKLASWLGIVPTVHQSADKYYNGRITKRGSKVARWMLTQIAHAAARTKKSKLKEFYLRKKDSLGFGKAIIALARKIVTITWHLITNDELYEDETGYEKNYIIKKKVFETISIPVDERIKILHEMKIVMDRIDHRVG